MIFKDRIDAGKRLANLLGHFKGMDGIILAIPRGGVVVASEISKALSFPIEIVIPRKIGAPNQPELAIGAISEDGSTILNEDIINSIGVSPEYIKEESERQLTEIARRAESYRAGGTRLSVNGKTVILVDDGIATGATLRAAVKSALNQSPANLSIAIPVGPPQTVKELQDEVDVICLHTPDVFYAIGAFYSDFRQTTDEEVTRYLEKSRE
ncbi:MAG: phosphoribosyltransferase [Nitrososphaerales archaeon]